MAKLTNPGGGGGFDYVQDSAPSDPTEGDEWYDTGDNAAYVYDGSNWIEQTVVDHSQLSGIKPTDHLSAGSGIAINNGEIDFTDHSPPTSTQSETTTSGRHYGFKVPCIDMTSNNDDNRGSSEDFWQPLTGTFTELQGENGDGSSHDLVVYYMDETTTVATISANSTEWFSVSQKPVAGVGTDFTACNVAGVNMVYNKSHSHNI